jgi:hypothetical protein
MKPNTIRLIDLLSISKMDKNFKLISTEEFLEREIQEFAELNNITYEKAKEILDAFYEEQGRLMEEEYRLIIRGQY